MTDDDYDEFRDQCVNDPLWAADEIERLRAIVTDLAALPRAYDSAPIDALICRARVATVDAPGETPA